MPEARREKENATTLVSTRFTFPWQMPKCRLSRRQIFGSSLTLGLGAVIPGGQPILAQADATPEAAVASDGNDLVILYGRG